MGQDGEGGPRALADFAGLWRLARDIDDRMAGQAGRFEGTARFEPDGAGLHYIEEGHLHLPNSAPMRATRRYRWQQDDDRIVIAFEDGRFFHDFRLGDDTPGAAHDCSPDLYRVAYDFSRWPSWSAVWEVSGPRKNYVMVSRYDGA